MFGNAYELKKCFLLRMTLRKQDNARETLIRISELRSMLGTGLFLAVVPFKVNPVW